MPLAGERFLHDLKEEKLEDIPDKGESVFSDGVHMREEISLSTIEKVLWTRVYEQKDFHQATKDKLNVLLRAFDGPNWEIKSTFFTEGECKPPIPILMCWEPRRLTCIETQLVESKNKDKVKKEVPRCC